MHLRLLSLLALATLAMACGNASDKPSFEGEPPAMDAGKLGGAQILIQYEGATRQQPQVIRSKAEAKSLAKELVERLRKGESFEALAREYSDDGMTAREGGDLGVFEPEERIRRISRALQTMHYGEIRGPLSSRFGFHILRRDRVELMGARQILLQHLESRNPAEGVERTREEAEALAMEILAKLEAGEAFEELARRYSDGAEAEAGGDLGIFARGDMIQPFEEAVLQIEVGAHSGVVESIYGFHLIQRTR